MGNTYSARTGESLRTACMSKYVGLTKPQVMSLRNTLLPLSSQRKGIITREYLDYAIRKTKINKHPDEEILQLLFTMWDKTGSGRVHCLDFIVGISILACKEDKFENALRFSLQVLDRERSGTISSKEASGFLRNICSTAQYMGDKVLTLKQTYKLVDAVFDTLTIISDDGEDMPHEDFVSQIVGENVVQDLVVIGQKRRFTSRARKGAFDTKLVDKETLKRIKADINEKGEEVVVTSFEKCNSLTEKNSEEYSVEDSTDDDATDDDATPDDVEDDDDSGSVLEEETVDSSLISSIMLTPLAKINLHQDQRN